MPQTGLLKLDLHLPANREKLRFVPFETGAKSLAFAVSFREPFPTPPAVLCAIAGFHSTPTDTFHLLVHPRDITTTGFRILLTAQHDNTVSTVTVSWLALESAAAAAAFAPATATLQ